MAQLNRSNLALIFFVVAIALACTFSLAGRTPSPKAETFEATLLYLNKLSANSGYTTFVTGTDGSIICYGDAAAKLVGGDLVGTNINNLFSNLPAEAFSNDSVGKIYIVKTKTATGPQNVRLIIKILHDHATYLVIMVLRDNEIIIY